jgi:GNAT superfamily N-acetyltransferase
MLLTDKPSKRAQAIINKVNNVEILEKHVLLEIEELAKSKEFAGAAFKHRITGQVYNTGGFHDVLQLPGADSDDFDLEAYDQGFVDHHGQFYNREEAARKISAPKGKGGLESRGYFSGEKDPTVEGLYERLVGMTKAIGSIQPGTHLLTNPKTGAQVYDYSHTLPEQARSQYRLFVRTQPKVNAIDVHVAPIGKHGKGAPAGAWNGNWEVGEKGVTLVPHNTAVHDKHRRRGLGLAMYEAAYAHAKHVLGATSVAGSAHSTGAAKLHMALGRKHGLEYKARPNVNSQGPYPNKRSWADLDAIGDYDGRYSAYSYALKSEAELDRLLEDWAETPMSGALDPVDSGVADVAGVVDMPNTPVGREYVCVGVVRG